MMTLAVGLRVSAMLCPNYASYIVLVSLISMAKTHLEHQLIRHQNKYKNATTIAGNPYESYNPKDGITTALILGISFILTIMYITIKYKCSSFKKRFCHKERPKVHRKDVESQISHNLVEGRNLREQMLLDPKWRNNLSQAYMLSKELGVPITVEDGIVALEPTEQVTTNSPSPSTPHVQRTRGDSVQVDTYTLVMSDNSKHLTKAAQSQSSSTLLDKVTTSACEESQQLLPPAANQALRTAHWVNTVISNEDSATGQQPKHQQPKSSKCVTRAEINHKEEGDNVVGTLDLATSEV